MLLLLVLLYLPFSSVFHFFVCVFYLLFFLPSPLLLFFTPLPFFSFHAFPHFLHSYVSRDHIIVWLPYCIYTCVPVSVNYSLMKATVGCRNIWIAVFSVLASASVNRARYVYPIYKEGNYPHDVPFPINMSIFTKLPKYWMAVITGYYANWPRSKDRSKARGPKSYWWQPVIASPVILQKMEEPQTAVSPLLGLINLSQTASSSSIMALGRFAPSCPCYNYYLLHDEAIHQRLEVCNIKSNAHFGVHWSSKSHI